MLASPTVAVDMAQLLATRIAEDGGIRLTDRAIEQIQQLLIGLEPQGTRVVAKEGSRAATDGNTRALASQSRDENLNKG